MQLLKCQNPCGLQEQCQTPYMGLDGAPHPRILVIGDAPGVGDDREGRLFTGRSGQLLRTTLEGYGIDIEKEVGFCTVLGCRPPLKEGPTPKQVKACKGRLLQALEQTKDTARLILLMGNYPLRTVLGKTGMTKWHGKAKMIADTIYFPCHHPDFINTNPYRTGEFVSDIGSALSMLSGDILKSIPVVNADAKYLEGHLEEILAAERLAYDTETSSLDPYSEDAYIIGPSFCWADDKACFVALEHPDLHIDRDEWLKRYTLVKKILEGPTPKVSHHGKYDRQILASTLGIKVANEIEDTMLFHHLLNERKGTHGLSKVVKVYLPEIGGYDAKMQMLMEEHKNCMPDIALKEIAPYACGDAYATFRLSHIFDEKLSEEGILDLALNLALPASLVYTAMEQKGVKLDIDRAGYLRREFRIKVRSLRAGIWDTQLAEDWEVLRYKEFGVAGIIESLAHAEQHGKFIDGKRLTDYRKVCALKKIDTLTLESKFNPNSPAQVKRALYEIAGMPVQHKLDKGVKKVTTNKEAREALLLLSPKKYKLGLEMVKALHYYSKINKLYTSFLQNYEDYIHDDGLVHTNFLQHGTKTGRLSNTHPNLQQMPKVIYADEDAPPLEKWLAEHNIKSMFVSKFGDKGGIMNADYSQLELRILACLSQDALMCGAYMAGSDLHTQTAKLLFPDFDSVGPAMQKVYRDKGKTWNFASVYAFRKEFLDMYPELGLWVSEQQHQAKTYGYTVNAFGRRRRVPEATRGFGDINAYLRQAVNFIIQSTGHDLLMHALRKVHNALSSEGLQSHLIFEVHDSIVVDCLDSERDRVAEILYREMEDISGLDWVTVPILSEVSYGPNWAEQSELENKWAA